MGGGGGSSRLCVDSIISFWVATAFTTTGKDKGIISSYCIHKSGQSSASAGSGYS